MQLTADNEVGESVWVPVVQVYIVVMKRHLNLQWAVTKGAATTASTAKKAFMFG